MQHDEIENLLGAYALDAVEDDEVEVIEQHLATCPRCRSELDAHLEVAALLGNSSEPAIHDLWDRIAGGLGGRHAETPESGALIVQLRQTHRHRRRLAVRLLAAAAAVAIVLLSLQVVNEDHQIHGPSTTSLAGAVAAAVAGPHQTIELTSTGVATPPLRATVVLLSDGTAYWTASDLATLPLTRTYQVWGLTRAGPVSISLLGPKADRAGTFRVESGITKLMVTDEPAGGTPAPTGSVLVSGRVPTSL